MHQFSNCRDDLMYDLLNMFLTNICMISVHGNLVIHMFYDIHNGFQFLNDCVGSFSTTVTDQVEIIKYPIITVQSTLSSSKDSGIKHNLFFNRILRPLNREHFRRHSQHLQTFHDETVRQPCIQRCLWHVLDSRSSWATCPITGIKLISVISSSIGFLWWMFHLN